ncbi:VPS10 domain-containing protein [Flammeovirga kamogawensis]|uniref:T9SS type A sorting domain-containing protein n=1 Tax=Flammeovirga kamogawensis TaxID=373891 RepID=A0ABX8GWU0_9BACT|nr:T9SS type A sorting domain-containing protein [Flammeovirga kamogawensis]MBB6460710.1 photosystem II stability/assembly factor-like uncharacterized protein [Flammeovirga kamogawensis]QWG08064.1 T9SS type A sorting domain-containing protein [Flammeovirga kamogawensis]TRX69870.1 T9SS type A sorting domain-containing protein [Flammeovirga kamogawensis]
MNKIYTKIFLLGIVGAVLCSVYFYQNAQNEKTVYASKDIFKNEYIKKKKKRENGYAKADQPDKFLEVLRSMKIRKGEKTPQYNVGYKEKELALAKVHDQEYFSNFRTKATEEWIERGPANVPGRTRTLVVDQNDNTNRTWFAGSVSGGIWKSTNRGESWVAKTDNLPNLSISHIVQSESNPLTFYASTGEAFGNLDGILGNGIIKSTDGGNTWVALTSTIENDDFQISNRIIVDPTDENTLLVCTSKNPIRTNNRTSFILKSTDGGNSWDKVYTGSNFIQQIIADPTDFTIQYATIAYVGIVKSTDAGATWSQVGSNINASGRIELAISPVNSSYIYASIAGNGSSSSDGNVYVSMDTGNTWERVNATNNEEYLGGQGWYDNTIMCHPFDQDIVYLGGVNLWKLELTEGVANSGAFTVISDAYGDGNNSYSQSTGSTVHEGLHPDHHSLQYVTTSANAFYIINTNDGGIYYSKSGTNPGELDGDWTFAGHGYNTTQFYGVDKQSGQNSYIGGSQDNGSWISSNNPTNASDYRRFLPGDGFEVAWNSSDSDLLLGSVYNNIILKSNNGGNNYFEANNGLTDLGEAAPFITKLAYAKEDPNTVYSVGASGVWKSTDFADNWKLLPISEKWIINSFIDVKISNASTDVIWAGAHMSDDYRVHVSKDKGNTFTPVENFTVNGFEMGPISGIGTNSLNPASAFVLFSFAHAPKIIRTNDYGDTWTELSGFSTSGVSNNGFPDVAVYDVITMPYNDEIIWVGTEIGIFESTDNGENWHKLSGGLPSVSIWDLKIVDNQVVVGTHGRGIWSFDLAEVPQPNITNFNSTISTTIIDYTISSSIDSIAVYSDSGNYLISIPNTVNAGENSIELSSEELNGHTTIQLISYLDGEKYKSVLKTLESVEYKTAQTEYYEDFSTYSSISDFTGDALVYNDNVDFFELGGFHSEHNYTNNFIKYSYLKIPIIVGNERSHFAYTDVAMISTDDDYVAVEVSKGGIDWVNLTGNYDASANDDWEYYVNQGSNGAQTLEVTHKYDLKDTFAVGDTILVRFKMNSDESNPNWGWAITNINIQSDNPILSIEENKETTNVRVYPTEVFDKKTTLDIYAQKNENIKYRIIDLIGSTMHESEEINVQIGANKIPIDLSNFRMGIYILTVESNNTQSSYKFIIR